MLSVECETSPPSNNSSNFKISSSTSNSKSNALNEAHKLREEGKKLNEQKSEFVVNGVLKLLDKKVETEVKIAITEEEVEEEGVIQVEAGKIVEEETVDEENEEEKK